MKKTALIAAGLLTTISSMAASRDAREILEVSGVQGGLVVVIGCDSPELLAELHDGGSCVVHGLDRDPGKVAAARLYLREKGLYGSVTAARWEGKHLPFVDSLVNLVVVSGEAQMANEEIVRVLAPNGVAVRQSPDTRHPTPFSANRGRPKSTGGVTSCTMLQTTPYRATRWSSRQRGCVGPADPPMPGAMSIFPA